eukprot:CAMPEP_0194043428 /NCGR_PEP_ID=MMETSP0009_2-20130614/15061_1 /TAXON_ID=210454 /ORGANISM="Grammatophora oceanica, Strain CCMP 410" /LENGTH=53 /DNA_ID=CAMNT_0038687629 /DNA_START=1 /DNA_END=159 /DNA_ORIENTATION=-
MQSVAGNGSLWDNHMMEKTRIDKLSHNAIVIASLKELSSCGMWLVEGMRTSAG